MRVSLRRLSLAVEVDEALHTPQQGGRHFAGNERAVVGVLAVTAVTSRVSGGSIATLMQAAWRA
jgi:hypothetical protein